MSSDAKTGRKCAVSGKAKNYYSEDAADTAETIQQAAAAAGESVNGYILAAVDANCNEKITIKTEKHLTKSHLHAKMCIMTNHARKRASATGLTHYTVLTYQREN